jgi:hypothetical protein
VLKCLDLIAVDMAQLQVSSNPKTQNKRVATIRDMLFCGEEKGGRIKP